MILFFFCCCFIHGCRYEYIEHALICLGFVLCLVLMTGGVFVEKMSWFDCGLKSVEELCHSPNGTISECPPAYYYHSDCTFPTAWKCGHRLTTQGGLFQAYFLVIYSFFMAFCILVWLHPGSALSYGGPLGLSSSLLLSEDSPQVPGRHSNRGPTFRQAGVLTNKLRYTPNELRRTPNGNELHSIRILPFTGFFPLPEKSTKILFSDTIFLSQCNKILDGHQAFRSDPGLLSAERLEIFR